MMCISEPVFLIWLGLDIEACFPQPSSGTQYRRLSVPNYFPIDQYRVQQGRFLLLKSCSPFVNVCAHTIDRASCKCDASRLYVYIVQYET
ncbi:hypothetical protein V8F06_004008 [Rhypophila decipiens]